MNDLIQTIKILDSNELKIINDYIDTLKFEDCKVFGANGENYVNPNMRSSSGLTMPEYETIFIGGHPIVGDKSNTVTSLLHKCINRGLEIYYAKVKRIHPNFGYYPVPCGIATKCWREGIQVLEYQPGQKYNFHHDAATDKKLKEYERKLSIILYLNDGFEGGGTEFIKNQVLKPEPGHAIMFPSNWCYPHSGQEVISGKKRIAVTWYYVDWA